MACSKALFVILLVAVANANAFSFGDFSDEYQPEFDDSAETEGTSWYTPQDLDEADDNAGEDDQDWTSPKTDAQQVPQPASSKPVSGGSTTWSNGKGLSVTTHNYDSVISIDGPEVHDTFDMPDAQVSRINNQLLVTSSNNQRLFSDTPTTLVLVKDDICTIYMYGAGKRDFSYEMPAADCANVQAKIKQMTPTDGVYNM